MIHIVEILMILYYVTDFVRSICLILSIYRFTFLGYIYAVMVYNEALLWVLIIMIPAVRF
jgi:hypothetical protein